LLIHHSHLCLVRPLCLVLLLEILVTGVEGLQVQLLRSGGH
jgi:hypothetical protein